MSTEGYKKTVTKKETKSKARKDKDPSIAKAKSREEKIYETSTKNLKRRGKSLPSVKDPRLTPASDLENPLTGYAPSDFERAIVRKMHSFGINTEEISKVLGISEHSLRGNYGYELDVGSTMRNLRVMETAYSMAVSGECFAATAFWLKCRAGWRETDKDPTGRGKSVKTQAEELRAALDAMDEMEEGEGSHTTTH